MSTIVLVARVGLAIVFATAGIAKLQDLAGSRQTMAAFGMPEPVARVGGTLLPFTEVATAVALVIQPAARGAAIAALILLAVFIGGIANALLHGRKPTCNCFGQVTEERISWHTLARNGALAIVAAFVTWKAPGRSVSAWTSHEAAADLVAVVAVVASAVLAAVALRYRSLHSTLQKRLFETSSELASLPTGLPIGMLAPSFELPDLGGNQVSLDSLCSRGRPVVLVFMSHNCGPCVRLRPDLGRWHDAMAERITLVAVMNGTDAPRLMADELRAAGDFMALMQDGQEVADAFRVRSTPMAVVVNPDGRVASAQAGGPVEIEELVRVTLRRSAPSRPSVAIGR